MTSHEVTGSVLRFRPRGGVPRKLVIAVGNPSRGDDALGPLLATRLEALALPDVEVLSDFQLQIEYVLDLADRSEVVFADASVSSPAPFTFTPLVPARDASFTSHAMSPASLLDAYPGLVGGAPPRASTLAIRGYAFELGAPLSARAAANLEAAFPALVDRLRD